MQDELRLLILHQDVDAARLALEKAGFGKAIAISDSSEGGSFYAERKDPLGVFVEKKWTAAVRYDKERTVQDVVVSSGLIGT